MNSLAEILQMEILGNQVETYAIALVVLGGIYIIFRFIISMVIQKLSRMAKKTSTDIDDEIVKLFDRNRWVAFLLLSIIYVDITLRMTDVAEMVIDGVFNVVAVLLVVRVVNTAIHFGTERVANEKKNSSEQFTVRLIGRTLKGSVWLIGALFIISAFGYNISSLIAGLGIGGIAIALAVQNILGDLISSVSIYLDKPFRVGDYIIVGTQGGTVKNIGLKTTRITSKTGEEIVMSNKKLTEMDINNFGRLKKRRATIPLGVTYDTKLKKMEKIPGGLKKIVKSVKDTEFLRAHFTSFGDSAKMFELTFYVESKDYETYLNKIEKINLKIQAFFEKEKIEFAYPTQTVYLKK